MAAGWAPTLTVIALGFGGWYSLESKIERVNDRLDRFVDPETGYPLAVARGVEEALARAIEKDQVLRLQVHAELSADMQEQFRLIRGEIAEALKR